MIHFIISHFQKYNIHTTKLQNNLDQNKDVNLN